MDIQLVDVGNNTIEVQLRPDGDWDSQDGLTNVTFTIRWSAAEGDCHWCRGPVRVQCPSLHVPGRAL
ncbi:MAG: hypothetical protein R2810_04120 [Flavobacteriales bacterium]